MHLLVSTQTVVGRAQDAHRAARGEFPYLGAGLFRVVYLNDAGTVVYKLVREGPWAPRYRDAARMQLQAECAEAIRLQAEGIPGIPDVTLYDVDGTEVLAMPFMSQSGCVAEQHPSFLRLRETWDRCGLMDLHDGNYAADASGFPYVIDLAGWAEAYVVPEQVPAPVLHPLVVVVSAKKHHAA